MQPYGRRKIRRAERKWKPKLNGKHVRAWWEDLAGASKARARREGAKQIEEDSQLPYFHTTGDPCGSLW